jgi:type I restriction enzyme S subunit
MLQDFDNLIMEIDSGLPAEIATRRQQYEYYRNKLLTFKELDVA